MIPMEVLVTYLAFGAFCFVAGILVTCMALNEADKKRNPKGAR
jgi:hypothetical protein